MPPDHRSEDEAAARTPADTGALAREGKRDPDVARTRNEPRDGKLQRKRELLAELMMQHAVLDLNRSWSSHLADLKLDMLRLTG
jgi:hypothetical protein